jgi:hypothetical protein
MFAMTGLLFLAATLLAPFLLSDGFVLVSQPRPSLTRVFVVGIETTNAEHSYYKGGNQRYTKPMVEPALLNHNVEDDEEWFFFDLATGDELCWNQAPTHPRNVVAASTFVVSGVASIPFFTVAEDYHKGGDAHFHAMNSPTKLVEECETPYIDFATGDELCWNDYRP